MQGLALVLRVFALRIPLSAYSAIQHAYVERHMIFKRYFFSTLGGTLISGVVGIIMAYKGFGAWALIAQYFTNTIVDILVLSITVPWHPVFAFSFSRTRPPAGCCFVGDPTALYYISFFPLHLPVGTGHTRPATSLQTPLSPFSTK